MEIRLALSSVPAGVLLRHIDPRDARVPLLDPLPLLLNHVLPESRDKNQLIVRPDGTLGVPNDLNHAHASQMLVSLMRCIPALCFQRRVRDARCVRLGDLLFVRPEREGKDVAPQFPWRRDGFDVVC